MSEGSSIQHNPNVATLEIRFHVLWPSIETDSSATVENVERFGGGSSEPLFGNMHEQIEIARILSVVFSLFPDLLDGACLSSFNLKILRL